MYEIKDVVQDIKAAAKRRKLLLIITPLLFLSAGVIALYFIEPKYQSYTSILVQKDETLNPLVLYEMAVNIASEDRLKSFNEIIFSRSAMEILIDSLQLDTNVKTDAEKQLLIAETRKNIKTSSRASDSFDISYINTDPVNTRDGVELLANYFIDKRLRMESRKQDETVTFFSNKLDELEVIVTAQRNQAVNTTEDRLKELPSDAAVLQERLQSFNEQLDSAEWKIIQEEQKLSILKQFQNNSNQADGIKLLYSLPLSETQFGDELEVLLKEYDVLKQQFTESYPKLKLLSVQIVQTANRIPPTIQANIVRYNSQKKDLVLQKAKVINEMQRSYVATQRAGSQLSDFSIYEGLLNEMKVKLEQAKISRDIGKRGAEQFIVLDAPFIPGKPISPNKKVVLSISLVIGIIMGIAGSALAEVMDTSMRDEKDLPYDKPIIAYISQG